MTKRRSGLPVLAFAHFAALESWFGSQPSDALGVWIKESGAKGDADKGRGDRRRALSRMDRRKARKV
jgi:hypothetical protein